MLIPSCARLIGRCAFVGCPQWKSGVIGNISGKSGDTTGELSLKGKGEVSNFYTHGMSWHEIRSLDKTAVIEEGIASIGDYAFSGCGNPASTNVHSSTVEEGINTNTNKAQLFPEIHRIAACGVQCIAIISLQ